MNSDNFDECEAWCHQGRKLAQLGHYKEALACYDQAVTIYPDNHTAWVLRGGVLTYLDSYKEALKSFERALKIQPENKDALLCRGVALHHLGEYRRAYVAFDQALGIERQPNWQEKLAEMSKGWLHSNLTRASKKVKG